MCLTQNMFSRIKLSDLEKMMNFLNCEFLCVEFSSSFGSSAQWIVVTVLLKAAMTVAMHRCSGMV